MYLKKHLIQKDIEDVKHFSCDLCDYTDTNNDGKTKNVIIWSNKFSV